MGGRDGKNSIEFIPWGTDWTFALMSDADIVFTRDPVTTPYREIVWVNSALTRWLFDNQRQLFVDKMKEMLEIWDADLYLGWAKTTLDLLLEAHSADAADQPNYQAAYEKIVAFLKSRKQVIEQDLVGIMDVEVTKDDGTFYDLL